MITFYSTTVFDNLIRVDVVSGLVGSPIYYHWYADGLYLGATAVPWRSFLLAEGQQDEIVVQDTLDPDFDSVLYAPPGWPARRTLWWIRSLGTDVDHYRVEESKDGGAWTAIAYIAHDADLWEYSTLTDRLDDLTDYAWRVVPVDTAGNDGTAVTLATERIVRRPDAPDFTVTFDPDTDRVTFAAA